MNSIQRDSMKLSLGLDPDLNISEARLRALWVEHHLQKLPASRNKAANDSPRRSTSSRELHSREASAA